MILYEIAVYWFLWFIIFKFCFENSMYHMMSLKPVSEEFAFITENFEFVISKSRHEPPSPLRYVSVSSYCKSYAP